MSKDADETMQPEADERTAPKADETTAPEANETSHGNNLNRKEHHDTVSPFHSVGFKTDVTKRIIKVLSEMAKVCPKVGSSYFDGKVLVSRLWCALINYHFLISLLQLVFFSITSEHQEFLTT
jgi:hypothetical protein